MKTALALALTVALAGLPAAAAPDPAEGKKLVAEKRCEQCHDAKKPAGAKSMYQRPGSRITDMPKLKAMVAMCNSELNLGLFPEDEEHVAAYLNDTYYRFGKK